ncbi:MAG: DUF1127 domain-containing protein [Alphaproteobacteria bacterium]
MIRPNFPHRATTPAGPGWVSRLAIAAADRLTDACLRSIQRRRLRELSDLGLRDIGISRANAWAEYRKPFWRR